MGVTLPPHQIAMMVAVFLLVLSAFHARATGNDDSTMLATAAGSFVAENGLVHHHVASTPAVEESCPSKTNRSRLYRGKALSDSLHVDELYEAYRETQSNYRNKTLTESDWKVLHVKQGVEVSILAHEEDPTCPYVRMRAVLPVPVQACWDFLRVPHWDRTMPIMDPYYEGVSVHGNLSHHPDVDVLLCRKRTKRILAFGKRDFVFLSVTEKEPLADGTWVSGTVSVDMPTLLPRQAGYTRVFQDSVAFYKPVMIDNKNHTDLTIVCRIDLNDSAGNGGGWIPMWLYVKTIGITGAQSVLRMKKALVELASTATQ